MDSDLKTLFDDDQLEKLARLRLWASQTGARVYLKPKIDDPEAAEGEDKKVLGAPVASGILLESLGCMVSISTGSKELREGPTVSKLFPMDLQSPVFLFNNEMRAQAVATHASPEEKVPLLQPNPYKNIIRFTTMHNDPDGEVRMVSRDDPWTEAYGLMIAGAARPSPAIGPIPPPSNHTTSIYVTARGRARGEPATKTPVRRRSNSLPAYRPRYLDGKTTRDLHAKATELAETKWQEQLDARPMELVEPSLKDIAREFYRRQVLYPDRYTAKISSDVLKRFRTFCRYGLHWKVGEQKLFTALRQSTLHASFGRIPYEPKLIQAEEELQQARAKNKEIQPEKSKEDKPKREKPPTRAEQLASLRSIYTRKTPLTEETKVVQNNDVTVRAIFHASESIAKLSLQFHFNRLDSNRPEEQPHDTAVIHLNHRNARATSIPIAKDGEPEKEFEYVPKYELLDVSQGCASLLHKLFKGVEKDYFVQLEKARVPGHRLFLFSIDHNDRVWGANVFSAKIRHPEHAILRDAMRQPKKVYVLIRYTDALVGFYERLFKVCQYHSIRNPLRGFFNDPDKMTIGQKSFKPASECPKFVAKPEVTFDNFFDYACRVGLMAYLNAEWMKESHDGYNGTARLMPVLGSYIPKIKLHAVYVAVYSWNDEVAYRPAVNDDASYQVDFRQDATVAGKHLFFGRMTKNMGFSPPGTRTGFVNRPNSKGVWNCDPIPGVDERQRQTREELIRGLRGMKPVPVTVFVKSDSKELKKQLDAVNSFHLGPKTAQADPLLDKRMSYHKIFLQLKNYELLELSSLYDIIPMEWLQQCLDDVYEGALPHQVAALDEWIVHGTPNGVYAAKGPGGTGKSATGLKALLPFLGTVQVDIASHQRVRTARERFLKDLDVTPPGQVYQLPDPTAKKDEDDPAVGKHWNNDESITPGNQDTTDNGWANPKNPAEVSGTEPVASKDGWGDTNTGTVPIIAGSWNDDPPVQENSGVATWNTDPPIQQDSGTPNWDVDPPAQPDTAVSTEQIKDQWAAGTDAWSNTPPGDETSSVHAEESDNEERLDITNFDTGNPYLHIGMVMLPDVHVGMAMLPEIRIDGVEATAEDDSGGEELADSDSDRSAPPDDQLLSLDTRYQSLSPEDQQLAVKQLRADWCPTRAIIKHLEQCDTLANANHELIKDWFVESSGHVATRQEAHEATLGLETAGSEDEELLRRLDEFQHVHHIRHMRAVFPRVPQITIEDFYNTLDLSDEENPLQTAVSKMTLHIERNRHLEEIEELDLEDPVADSDNSTTTPVTALVPYVAHQQASLPPSAASDGLTVSSPPAATVIATVPLHDTTGINTMSQKEREMMRVLWETFGKSDKQSEFNEEAALASWNKLQARLGMPMTPGIPAAGNVDIPPIPSTKLLEGTGEAGQSAETTDSTDKEGPPPERYRFSNLHGIAHEIGPDGIPKAIIEPGRIGLLAPTNALADQMHTKFKALCDVFAKKHDLKGIVCIRYHPWATEGKAAAQMTNPLFDDGPQLPNIIDEQFIVEDDLARQIQQRFIKSKQGSEHRGISDKRFIQAESSLARYISELAGTMDMSEELKEMFPPAELEQIQSKLHAMVAAQGQILQEAGHFTPDIHRDIAKVAKLARAYLLMYAPVVTSTVSASFEGPYKMLRHNHIELLDESSRVAEQDSIGLFSLHSACQKRFFLGDHKQTSPADFTPQLVNCYNAQVKLSMFHRMESSGFPMAEFNVTHRFGNAPLVDLCNLVNDPANIVMADGAARDVDTALVTRYNMQHFEIKSSNVFLNVKCQDAQRDASGSIYNLDTLNVSLNEVFKRSKIVDGSTILLVSPYRAQVDIAINVHEEHCRELRKLRDPAVDSYARVQFKTVDELQGGEADQIILDDCKHLGFLGDKDRTNVAFTRAKIGYVWIGDATKITAKDGNSGTLLRKVAVWFDQQGLIWTFTDEKRKHLDYVDFDRIFERLGYSGDSDFYTQAPTADLADTNDDEPLSTDQLQQLEEGPEFDIRKALFEQNGVDLEALRVDQTNVLRNNFDTYFPLYDEEPAQANFTDLGQEELVRLANPEVQPVDTPQPSEYQVPTHLLTGQDTLFPTNYKEFVDLERKAEEEAEERLAEEEAKEEGFAADDDDDGTGKWD